MLQYVAKSANLRFVYNDSVGLTSSFCTSEMVQEIQTEGFIMVGGF